MKEQAVEVSSFYLEECEILNFFQEKHHGGVFFFFFFRVD